MKQEEHIAALRYRISRYKAMGNGAKCQTLLNELRKLEK